MSETVVMSLTVSYIIYERKNCSMLGLFKLFKYIHPASQTWVSHEGFVG